MPTPDEVRVLIVDDEPANRELLTERLNQKGYQTESAEDGSEAWSMLSERPGQFDVILLDRRMPKMSGLELLAKIKEHGEMKMIPVIIQTAVDDQESIVEGIEAGAYYYLTKPLVAEMLLSIVKAAANDYFQYRQLQEEVEKRGVGMALLREGFFELQSVREAVDLATVLSNSCPDPAKTVVGLTELLINAVEHGNLDISYQEKSALTANGRWNREIEHRLALPENAGKRVRIHFQRDRRFIRITITDEGEGFDWRPYLEIDPRRAFDTHGRGIAMANLFSFDHLEYHSNGNQVTGTIEIESES